jgi:transposase-like protein
MTKATPQTLMDAIRYFADRNVTLDLMVAIRWPDGVVCPTCGSKEVTFLKTRRLWKCKNRHPKQQFSAKVGTIFEDSPIGLDKWFTAMWLIANCKNGISSYEIARDLHVTQKTAWFMDHRIRFAMKTGSFEKMKGEVEADETFIGGLARFMHKDRREAVIKGTGGAGKVAVMGLLERHGKDRISHVRAKVLRNVRATSLHKEIRDNVEAGSEMFTDAWVGYKHIDRDYVHNVIDHAEKYAEGRVHVNGIENFWSLLKRGIKGTYVSVEPFHLFRYLDEQAFRFNMRKNSDGQRFIETLSGVTGRRVTYKELTGKEVAPTTPQ